MTEQERLGTDDMLLEYAPLVMPGVVGALMHAVIHLGWGIDAGHRFMIAEGALLPYCGDLQPHRNVHMP